MAMDVLEMWRLIYQEELPGDIGPMRQLLEQYSKIAAGNVDSHLYAIRQKAWAIARYPCIGRWRFLQMDQRNDPRYQHVLNRLRDPASGDALLDLGCCVGQFIRQLSFDGVNESRLIGTDLYQSFINIGYDLFRDRDRLRATFVAGDMLDPNDKGLQALDGRITIIHANNFWHLFNWQQQVAIAVRLVGFLKKGRPRAMIYGRQIGRTKPADPIPLHSGVMKKSSTSWLHNQESFQRLWDEVGVKTGTRWKVAVEFVGDLPWKIPGFGTDSKPARYGVYQL